MKLIIAEKTTPRVRSPERLSTGKPKRTRCTNTAIYRFEWKGERCVTIGLAGHILRPIFGGCFDKSWAGIR